MKSNAWEWVAASMFLLGGGMVARNLLRDGLPPVTAVAIGAVVASAFYGGGKYVFGRYRPQRRDGGDDAAE